MSFRIALLLAAVIFSVTIVARLPAQLLVSHLPAQIRCEEPAGTIWRGTCGQMSSANLSIPGLSWQLHPLALLRLALSVDLNSVDPDNGGSASVLAQHDGNLSVTALNAVVPLGPGPSVLPTGSTGVLSLALPSLLMRTGHLSSLNGTAELRNLHLSNPALDLGSFQIQFAPDAADAAATEGQVRDLEGPLAVNGVLRLQSNGSFDLNGTVAARATATDDLNRTLQMFLGPEDAQGRHPFSLSGTL
jgi:hypothetical protein